MGPITTLACRTLYSNSLPRNSAREQRSDRKDPGRRVRIQCSASKSGDREEQQHARGRGHPPRQLVVHLEGTRGDPLRTAAVLSEVQWEERDFHGWSVPEEEWSPPGNAQELLHSVPEHKHPALVPISD